MRERDVVIGGQLDVGSAIRRGTEGEAPGAWPQRLRCGCAHLALVECIQAQALVHRGRHGIAVVLERA
ncbi:MAG TPA: hypothetical protein VF169_03630 [Albitalea sp.]|uniref:hypothetical protein n=1 Tax=Piscinibacter sp. TaxID=1903157 RepID=UPI002ED679B4